MTAAFSSPFCRSRPLDGPMVANDVALGGWHFAPDSFLSVVCRSGLRWRRRLQLLFPLKRKFYAEGLRQEKSTLAFRDRRRRSVCWEKVRREHSIPYLLAYRLLTLNSACNAIFLVHPTFGVRLLLLVRVLLGFSSVAGLAVRLDLRLWLVSTSFLPRLGYRYGNLVAMVPILPDSLAAKWPMG
ncbi:MAG: hypothetical protein U1D30_14130 [Planctomycetota bacterium]